MSKQNTLSQEFLKGLWKENPNLVQLLGMCPMLAVTNEVVNAIGMAGAVTFVLLASALIISLIRSWIPAQVRIPTFIVIIAGFVTMADRYLAAFYPDLSKALGPFVPLIVVNCVILGRMEAFASKNKPGRSVIDALGMSVGFGIVLLIMGAVRELLGNGTILGAQILSPNWYDPMMVFILPAGAFLTLGLLIGVSNLVQKKLAGR
ncbi:MAG TPA: electron transport complex subunit E [Thermoanaerobaculia bacterium]|nr:electron transport complex subunit E [Thermoanaerobaculia bacterium]HUM28977.1 electron transport complex subunit E [Thermoanaerobaculia bacterium]HXK67091.1 electron transport complex subunit E [Thermoanaerobaculia bacterium]